MNCVVVPGLASRVTESIEVALLWLKRLIYGNCKICLLAPVPFSVVVTTQIGRGTFLLINYHARLVVKGSACYGCVVDCASSDLLNGPTSGVISTLLPFLTPAPALSHLD